VLWRIRNPSTPTPGGCSDRLTFDEQESIAELLGYGPRVRPALERLTERLYRAARTISRSLELHGPRLPVMSRPHAPRETLGRGFRLFDGAVHHDDADALARTPRSLSRLVAAAVSAAWGCSPGLARVGRACSDPPGASRCARAPSLREFVAPGVEHTESSLRASRCAASCTPPGSSGVYPVEICRG